MLHCALNMSSQATTRTKLSPPAVSLKMLSCFGLPCIHPFLSLTDLHVLLCSRKQLHSTLRSIFIRRCCDLVFFVQIVIALHSDPEIDDYQTLTFVSPRVQKIAAWANDIFTTVNSPYMQLQVSLYEFRSSERKKCTIRKKRKVSHDTQRAPRELNAFVASNVEVGSPWFIKLSARAQVEAALLEHAPSQIGSNFSGLRRSCLGWILEKEFDSHA